MYDSNKDNLVSHSTPEPVIIFSGSHKEAMEISLLLASQSIPHQIYVEQVTYQIRVIFELGDQVRDLISLYQKENKDWLTELTQHADISLLVSPLLFLIPATVGYFFQFSHNYIAHNITVVGRSDSVRILAGEWWRVFTALTLHSGPQHYLSNMFSGFFLINLLVHRISFGFAISLVIISSGLANFTVALMTWSGHYSIGFSTAVFAALGILASIQLKENLLGKRISKRSLIPLFWCHFNGGFHGNGRRY